MPKDVNSGEEHKAGASETAAGSEDKEMHDSTIKTCIWPLLALLRQQEVTA